MMKNEAKNKCVLMVVALVLCAAGVSFGAIQPVLYYTFDDSADLGADSSGNGYDLTGNATYDAAGAVGGAVLFNGTSSDFLGAPTFA